LMRHGSHLDGVLTREGSEAVSAHARRLAEVLAGRVRLTDVLHSEPSGEPEGTGARSSETLATARVVAQETGGDVTARPLGEAFPGCELPGAYAEPDRATRAIEELVAHLEPGGPGRARATGEREHATLLVGNDPALGWLGRRLTGKDVPLLRGEIACLQRRAGKRWRLSWTIGPADEDLCKDLRAKIASKMNVAKVFGGVVVGVFTFLVQQFFAQGVPSAGAFAALLVIAAAAALYFATLFSYDSLLMPSRFWGEGSPRDTPAWLVRRPPSSQSWILYQNMMHTWNWQFVPATALLGFGLLLVGAVAFSAPGEDAPALELWPLPALYLAWTVSVVTLWILLTRPRLGAED